MSDYRLLINGKLVDGAKTSNLINGRLYTS